MHTIAQFIVETFAPLARVAAAFAHGFTWLACGAGPHGMFALGAFVVTSMALAIGCGAWATIERVRSRSHLDRMRMAVRQSQIALLLRDRVIELFDDSAVVFRTRTGTPLNFRDGLKLLQVCLAGPDSRRLAVAMDGLFSHGLPFVTDIRTIGVQNVALSGYRVGSSAVILLKKVAEARIAPASAHVAKPGPAPSSQGASYGPLDRPAQEMPVAPEHSVTIREEMRVVPATAPAARQHTEDSAKDAFAVIGPDGRLQLFSDAFAEQWGLGDGDLRGAPHISRLAARCRETRGRDAIWEVVADAVSSPAPERHAGWGPLMRGDGRAVSLHMTRLPDGATRIRFVEGKPYAGTNIVPFAAKARAA